MDALYDAAVSAMNRYARSGKVKDLDMSLDIGRTLLADAPSALPDRLAYLNLYAGVLDARYERLGDLSDLTSAIDTMH